MARAISDEEIKLRGKARRRLIGAIALVVLMIVFLPMVLVSRPKPAAHDDVEINIPTPSSAPSIGSQLVMPRPSLSQPAPAPVAVMPPAGKSASSANGSVLVPAKDSAHSTGRQRRPRSVSSIVTPAVTTPRKRIKRYAVQVAAFSHPGNAHKLQARLTLNAIQAYTEVFKTPQGKRIRVRVGPFGSRAAAEVARTKLEKIKLKGNIVTVK